VLLVCKFFFNSNPTAILDFFAEYSFFIFCKIEIAFLLYYNIIFCYSFADFLSTSSSCKLL
jgi:hypothetical protein